MPSPLNVMNCIVRESCPPSESNPELPQLTRPAAEKRASPTITIDVHRITTSTAVRPPDGGRDGYLRSRSRRLGVREHLLAAQHFKADASDVLDYDELDLAVGRLLVGGDDHCEIRRHELGGQLGRQPGALQQR